MRELEINHIKVKIVKDYEEMSKVAADYMIQTIKQKPNCSLGLATGSTPIGLYNELVRRYTIGELSFKYVTTYNLDEYYPIDQGNCQSYNYFMREHLFNHIDMIEENIHIPKGIAASAQEESMTYEKQLRASGGVDLQLLGIGTNGHIGFNEPSEIFEARTHKVMLDEQTIKDNARFFNSVDEVPCEAITMGIGTIMSAKSILLLANGKNKAKVLKEMLLGGVTPHIPASVLQLHPDVTAILDEAAASEL